MLKPLFGLQKGICNEERWRCAYKRHRMLDICPFKIFVIVLWYEQRFKSAIFLSFCDLDILLARPCGRRLIPRAVLDTLQNFSRGRHRAKKL